MSFAAGSTFLSSDLDENEDKSLPRPLLDEFCNLTCKQRNPSSEGWLHQHDCDIKKDIKTEALEQAMESGAVNLTDPNSQYRDSAMPCSPESDIFSEGTGSLILSPRSSPEHGISLAEISRQLNHEDTSSFPQMEEHMYSDSDNSLILSSSRNPASTDQISLAQISRNVTFSGPDSSQFERDYERAFDSFDTPSPLRSETENDALIFNRVLDTTISAIHNAINVVDSFLICFQTTDRYNDGVASVLNRFVTEGCKAKNCLDSLHCLNSSENHSLHMQTSRHLASTPLNFGKEDTNSDNAAPGPSSNLVSLCNPCFSPNENDCSHEQLHFQIVDTSKDSLLQSRNNETPETTICGENLLPETQIVLEKNQPMIDTLNIDSTEKPSTKNESAQLKWKARLGRICASVVQQNTSSYHVTKPLILSPLKSTILKSSNQSELGKENNYLPDIPEIELDPFKESNKRDNQNKNPHEVKYNEKKIESLAKKHPLVELHDIMKVRTFNKKGQCEAENCQLSDLEISGISVSNNILPKFASHRLTTGLAMKKKVQTYEDKENVHERISERRKEAEMVQHKPTEYPSTFSLTKQGDGTGDPHINASIKTTSLVSEPKKDKASSIKETAMRSQSAAPKDGDLLGSILKNYECPFAVSVQPPAKHSLDKTVKHFEQLSTLSNNHIGISQDDLIAPTPSSKKQVKFKPAGELNEVKVFQIDENLSKTKGKKSTKKLDKSLVEASKYLKAGLESLEVPDYFAPTPATDTTLANDHTDIGPQEKVVRHIVRTDPGLPDSNQGNLPGAIKSKLKSQITTQSSEASHIKNQEDYSEALRLPDSLTQVSPLNAPGKVTNEHSNEKSLDPKNGKHSVKKSNKSKSKSKSSANLFKQGLGVHRDAPQQEVKKHIKAWNKATKSPHKSPVKKPSDDHTLVSSNTSGPQIKDTRTVEVSQYSQVLFKEQTIELHRPDMLTDENNRMQSLSDISKYLELPDLGTECNVPVVVEAPIWHTVNSDRDISMVTRVSPDTPDEVLSPALVIVEFEHYKDCLEISLQLLNHEKADFVSGLTTALYTVIYHLGNGSITTVPVFVATMRRVFWECRQQYPVRDPRSLSRLEHCQVIESRFNDLLTSSFSNEDFKGVF